jgi:E3 ubiquitin-protein ligase SHPRH
LLQKNQKQNKRYLHSLNLLLDCRQRADDLMERIRSYMRDVREEAGKLHSARGTPGNEAGDPSGLRSSPMELEDREPEDEGFPKTKAGEELRTRHRALQSRLRECQVTLHKIIFLTGDTFNILGNAEKEREAYEEADVLRKRLLQGMWIAFDWCWINKLALYSH